MEQPVGVPVTGSSTAPQKVPLHGRYTSLVPLEPAHAKPLFKHLGGEDRGYLWTYMFGGPYNDENEWLEVIAGWSEANEPMYYTVLSGPASDASSEPVGMAALMNTTVQHRHTEIGCVIFAEVLKQTRQATEAIYTLLKYSFDDLKLRRVEWKLNSLNKPSAAAAERFGFVYEGLFRKHFIIKGLERHTTWYAMTDDEWPLIKQAFEAWLHDDNFDSAGKQKRRLQDIRESLKSGTA